MPPLVTPFPKGHPEPDPSVICRPEKGLVPFRDNGVNMLLSTIFGARGLTARIMLIGGLMLSLAGTARAQSGYETITVSDGGTIRGTVKWTGTQPKELTVPITKDPEICDPGQAKKRDLERLVIGPGGGVANTVVYLKGISRGKAMDLPEPRRFLDQKHCRYEPHVLLVPEGTPLKMESSDAVLHTVHMMGAASFNLPFPFQNQVVSRVMPSPGLIDVRCNGGHTWMNAEIMVVAHPYYAVTDESGKFELTDVPAGEYQIVAWHEGWNLVRQEAAFDVLTQRKVSRPVFSEPKTWQKSVNVSGGRTAQVEFEIGEK